MIELAPYSMVLNVQVISIILQFSVLQLHILDSSCSSFKHKQHVVYTGSELSTTDWSQTMDDCEQKCRSTDHCVGFNMQLQNDTAGQCTLKSSMEAPMQAIAHSGSSVNIIQEPISKLNTKL